MEVFDGIHAWSMSKDEHKAVTGRCLKQFYEAFDSFDREECNRGIHRGIVIFGIVHAVAIISAITALSGVKKGHRDHAIESVINVFSDVVRQVAGAATNQRVDGENT
jgi:hypothetical protein